MEVPNANIRATSYYIAEMRVRCAKCGRQVPVFALGVPPNHELQVEGEWQNVDANALIFHVTELPEAVCRQMLERSPAFRLQLGQDAADLHWANHCEHCGGLFSEDELHCEQGGFMPSRAQEAEAIFLSQVLEEFSACAAGYALEPEFFATMRRR
jgi:adenine-specific DNA methylase